MNPGSKECQRWSPLLVATVYSSSNTRTKTNISNYGVSWRLWGKRLTREERKRQTSKTTEISCQKVSQILHFHGLCMFNLPKILAIANVQLIFCSWFYCRFFWLVSNCVHSKKWIKDSEDTLDRSSVYRWCKMFSESQVDVNEKERAESLSR